MNNAAPTVREGGESRVLQLSPVELFLMYGAATEEIKEFLTNPLTFCDKPQEAMESIITEAEALSQDRITDKLVYSPGETFYFGSMFGSNGKTEQDPFEIKRLGRESFRYSINPRIPQQDGGEEPYFGWLSLIQHGETQLEAGYIDVPSILARRKFDLRVRALRNGTPFFDFEITGTRTDKFIQRPLATRLTYMLEHAAILPATTEDMYNQVSDHIRKAIAADNHKDEKLLRRRATFATRVMQALDSYMSK